MQITIEVINTYHNKRVRIDEYTCEGMANARRHALRALNTHACINTTLTQDELRIGRRVINAWEGDKNLSFDVNPIIRLMISAQE